MYALIQRVLSSSVAVNEKTIANIEHGILAFIGIAKDDTINEAKRTLEKILNYRIFQDDNNNMNLSVKDINGGLLLVPQFTLAADTKKGLRPSFSSAKPPNEAQPLFLDLTEHAKNVYDKVACGEFGANMQVHLINDGPVTFMLQF